MPTNRPRIIILTCKIIFEYLRFEKLISTNCLYAIFWLQLKREYYCLRVRSKESKHLLKIDLFSFLKYVITLIACHIPLLIEEQMK